MRRVRLSNAAHISTAAHIDPEFTGWLRGADNRRRSNAWPDWLDS
jgi:hypothetical protein